MLTPKVLGVILITAGIITRTLSIHYENKLALFYSYMMFLFGGAAFVRMKANVITLKGKNILITGCDSGIGYALATYLSELEACVFAGFLDSESEAAEYLKKKFPNIHIMQIDVTKSNQIVDAYSYVFKKLGDDELWAVVNNAGLNFNGPVEMTSLTQYRKIMDINYFGVIEVTKAFLPLIRQSSGRIVNISSVKGRYSWPFCAAYSASKYALESFSDSLRRELQNFDVKVILIEPGHFGGATNCLQDTDRIKLDFDDMWNASSDEVKETYGKEYLDAVLQGTLHSSNTSAKRLDTLVHKISETIATDNPKDRYVFGGSNSILFDPYKIEMLFSLILPTTLMDLYCSIHHMPPLKPKEVSK